MWILISWLLQKPADLDLHCFQEKPADQDPYCLQELIWFHTVFERINSLSTVRYKLICSFGQVKYSTDKYILAFCLSLDKYNFFISTPLTFHSNFLEKKYFAIWTFFLYIEWRFKLFTKLFFFLLPLFKYIYDYYAPAMIMARALCVTPVPTYVSTYVCPDDVRSLNRILLIRILWKLVTLLSTINVFFKFDNGPYRTRLSVVMALCLWKFTVLNDVRSLSWIFFIRI